ncbi:hypothetical protein D3C75_1212730 [compost metagenome]
MASSSGAFPAGSTAWTSGWVMASDLGAGAGLLFCAAFCSSTSALSSATFCFCSWSVANAGAARSVRARQVAIQLQRMVG